VDNKKNVSIGHEAKIFRLQLVFVFATGVPVTKLDFQHLLIKEFGNLF
jgi:hypothetical protein